MSTATAWRIVEAGQRITAIRPIDPVCLQARHQDADDQLQRSPDQALWMLAKQLVDGADIRLLVKDTLRTELASHRVHVYGGPQGRIIYVAASRSIGGRWEIVRATRVIQHLGDKLLSLAATEEAQRITDEAGGGYTPRYAEGLAETIAEAMRTHHLRPEQASARVWGWEGGRVYA